MEAYLNLYYRYISKLKNGVNISDTLEFINSDTYDTDEVINTYKDVINIKKICKQLNYKNFLPDYRLKEKVNTFLEFFTNLHNYAKNLLTHFDIYSTKAIQASSAVIVDNLKLFPHYKRYMEKLLGYEYDAVNSEWVMRQENNQQLRYQLSAVCIMAAIGYQRIDGMKSQQDYTDDSDVNDENNMSLNKWYCAQCSSINDISHVNCVVCLSEKPCDENIDESHRLNREDAIDNENNLKRTDTIVCDNRKRNISKKWNCGVCSLENDLEDWECAVCGSIRTIDGNQLFDIGFEKDILTDRRLIERNTNIDPMPAGVGRMRIETNVMSEQGWVCRKCTLRNDAKATVCEACSEKGLSHAPSTIKPKRLDENHWQCEFCTFINNNQSLMCDACFRERSQPTQRKCDQCSSFYDVGSKCTVCHGKKGDSLGNDRIKRKPVYVNELSDEKPIRKQEWICEQCSTRNDITNGNCSTCYRTRKQTKTPKNSPSIHGRYAAGIVPVTTNENSAKNTPVRRFKKTRGKQSSWRLKLFCGRCVKD